jgi:hypothetical protein
MTDAPDLDTLAQQYLDLWQDHVTALANDPSVHRALSQALAVSGMAPPAGGNAADAGMAQAQAIAAAWPAMMAAAMGNPVAAAMQASGEESGRGHDNGRAHGTASAAAASGDGAGHLDELLRRVAALEDRLAALESERAGDRRAQRAAPPASGGDGDA